MTNPAFLLFFGAVACAGLIVFAIAALLGSRGHRVAGAWVLVASGALLFAGGIAMFAPQPLWVGGALGGLGLARFLHSQTRDVGDGS